MTASCPDAAGVLAKPAGTPLAQSDPLTHASRGRRRPENHPMQHVLIIHEVESYPAWKVYFDQATEIRKQAGEIRYQLLREDKNANTIVHFSVWSSLENARRFFESPELVEIRRQAGVKAPDFIYLHEIEHGIL
jgi:quinol monooxygenase YgiN